jgi:hypothetical protein
MANAIQEIDNGVKKVGRRNDNRTVWRMNLPLLILEYSYAPHLCWNATKIVDLWMVKLYGVPQQPPRKKRNRSDDPRKES